MVKYCYHFTWNFISGILGSLDEGGGIFHVKFKGNKLLTGGEFGLEFSLLIVITGIILGIYLIILAHKKGLIISPYWKRSNEKLNN